MAHRMAFGLIVVCTLAVACDKGKDGEKTSGGGAALSPDKYIDEKVAAEAREGLGQIGKLMSAAFEMERMSDGVLEQGASTAVLRKLCPAAKPVPASLDDVKDRKKYMSTAAEWNDGGWACLKFHRDSPQYWQYEVKSDPDKGSFTAYARRKLGEQIVEFSLSGVVQNGALSISPAITEGTRR